MQMSFFFLLPNILLSGFMFPFEAHAAARADPGAGAAPHPLLAHRARYHPEGRRLLPTCATEFLWMSVILFALVVLASLRFTQEARLTRSRQAGEKPCPDLGGYRTSTRRRGARASCSDGVDGASLRAIAADAGTSIGMVVLLPHQGRALPRGGGGSVREARAGPGAARWIRRCPCATASSACSRGSPSSPTRRSPIVRLVVREALVSSSRLDRLVERFRRGHVAVILKTVFDGFQNGTFDRNVNPSRGRARHGRARRASSVDPPFRRGSLCRSRAHRRTKALARARARALRRRQGQTLRALKHARTARVFGQPGRQVGVRPKSLHAATV